MTVLRIPWVLPPDWKWALGLLAIGFFGFGGQVSDHDSDKVLEGFSLLSSIRCF